MIRLNACMKQVGDKIQVIGGTNFGGGITRCLKSMEVLHLKNQIQVFKVVATNQTTKCDELLCFDENEVQICNL